MSKAQENPALTKANSSSGGVARAALVTSMGTLSSRILGLVRDQILFAFYSRTVTDAFSVAFRLPNMFRRLLGEGSLSVAFIPIYIDQMTKEGSDQEANARELASSVFTLLIGLSSLLSVAGIVWMEPILNWLVSGEGYQSIEGKLELTVWMAQIMFVYLFLVTTYAYLSAILQAHKKFFIAALAPAAFNFVFCIFALLPQEWVSRPGEWLAWGVIAGGLAQAGLVAGLLIRLGRMPGIKFGWRKEAFRKILRNVIPGILGMGVLQLMSVVNVKFASRLPEGAQSYIYLGDRLLEMPQALIAISLGTAMLPNLSELWSRGQKAAMVEAAQRHTRFLLFLALPSAVGLFVLARSIVEVLFMHGAFSARDAEATTQVIQIYSVLLATSSWARVTTPCFYAIHNTWLPATLSVVTLCVHIVVANFAIDQFGLAGLVGSTTLTGTLNLVLLLIFFRLLIGPIGLAPLLKSLLRLLPALLGMALAVGFIDQSLFSLLGEVMPKFFAQATALLTALMAGIAIFFSLCMALGHEEGQYMIQALKRRLRR